MKTSIELKVKLIRPCLDLLNLIFPIQKKRKSIRQTIPLNTLKIIIFHTDVSLIFTGKEDLKNSYIVIHWCGPTLRSSCPRLLQANIANSVMPNAAVMAVGGHAFFVIHWSRSSSLCLLQEIIKVIIICYLSVFFLNPNI
jgi:hypothetical protein